VTVSASASSRSRTSRSTARSPPARWKSSIKYRPAGWRSTSIGTRDPIRSKSSSVNSTPDLPAIARRWTTALADPPNAARETIALWKLAFVRNVPGRRSVATISTADFPVPWAAWRSRLSGAGVPATPGTTVPSASATNAIVDADHRRLGAGEVGLGEGAGADLLGEFPHAGCAAQEFTAGRVGIVLSQPPGRTTPRTRRPRPSARGTA